MDTKKIEKITPIHFFHDGKFIISNWTKHPITLKYWFGKNDKKKWSYVRDINANSTITIRTNDAFEHPKPLALAINLLTKNYSLKKGFEVEEFDRYAISLKNDDLVLEKVKFGPLKITAK